ILGAHAEQIAGRSAAATVRDPLTTLITSPVFMLALEQEIERALRHQHSLALLLFDIDDLAHINRDQGWGVGDRILERMGILARRFFRMHDWVARHADNAIAVLLPETTVDQAAVLAGRFREMVQDRLVQQDHKTNTTKLITVSAAGSAPITCSRRSTPPSSCRRRKPRCCAPSSTAATASSGSRCCRPPSPSSARRPCSSRRRTTCRGWCAAA